MAIVKPDFSENMFAPAAAGTHFARVIGAETGHHPAQGNYVAWTFETFGNEDDNQNNKKIFHRTPIAGQFSGGLNLLLKALNPDVVFGPDFQFDTDDYMGKELEVTIEYPVDKKTGKLSEYSRVKKVAQYVAPVGESFDTKSFDQSDDKFPG